MGRGTAARAATSIALLLALTAFLTAAAPSAATVTSATFGYATVGASTVTVSAPTGGIAGPGIALPNKSAFRSAADMAFELDQSKLIGARWIRSDLGWGINASYDAHVNGIHARGMKVLANIGSTGKNAFGVAGAKYTPSSYKTLVQQSVPHYYAMGVRDFEILNEPNLNGYTWQEYLAIVQAAYPAMKDAAPNARVWVGSFGIGQSARDHFNNFVKPQFPAIASVCDGISIHAADLAYEGRWWNMQAWAWGPLGPEITDTIRGLLDRNGGAGKPIIISEFGGGPLPRKSESMQAAEVAAAADDTRPLAVAAYAMLDDDVAGFGLLRPDRTQRPAWNAFQAAAAS